MDIYDVVDSIIGEDSNGKYKTSIGFFVEQWSPDGSSKVLDEFMVEKPIIQISEFSDEVGNEYNSFEFKYKSKRDEDLRQQWQFLERFVKRFNSTEDPDKTPILVISFLPISLKGKFTLHATGALPHSILKMEYANDNACSIKIVFLKEHVIFLSHDPTVVDSRAIEEEVIREIDDELAENYPIESSAKMD